MQDRLGPNRANIGPIKLKGILHFVADAVKMIFKEDFIPANVHKGLFTLAPILALAPVLIAFAIIPFGPTIYPHSSREALDPYAARDAADEPAFARLDPHADVPGRLRPDLLLRGAHARELRRHDRRLGQLQQVGAARRPAQLVADDVVRGRDGPLADRRVPRRPARLEPGHIALHGASDVDVGRRTRSTGCGCGSRSASCCSSPRRSRRPSARRSTSPRASPRSSATSSSTPACAGACSSSPSSSRSCSSRAVIATVFFGGWQVPFLDADGFRIGGYVDPVNGDRRSVAAFRRCRTGSSPRCSSRRSASR